MDNTDYFGLDFEDPPKAVKPAKGVCGKCGKHIGRGLYAHQKACK